MIRHHVLVVTTSDDHFPDGDPDDPDFPNPDDAQLDYDGRIECATPDLCNGWQECSRDFDHARMVRNGEPTVAPHPEGDEHDVEEMLLHGEWHTYRWGWGWTVKYPGCVVAGHDDVNEFVYDIGREHGPGVYWVDDDWDDDSLSALDVFACSWPRPPACEACGSPLTDAPSTALLNTGDGCLPLDLPPARHCRSTGCRQTRDARALAAARATGVLATAPCAIEFCSAIGVWPDGTCDRHHREDPE